MGFISDNTGATSWSEFNKLTDNFQNALRKLGVRSNDFFPIVMDSSRSCYAALEACMQFNVVAVPIRPKYSPDVSLNIMQQTGANVYASRKRIFPKDKILQEFQDLIVWETSYKEAPVTRNVLSKNASLVFFSSGTTGTPKGICISKSNVEFTTETLVNLFEITKHDRILNVIPSSFDYGLYQYFFARKVGATLFLKEGRHFPSQLYEDCVELKPSILPLMPSIFSLYSKIDSRKASGLVFSDEVKITSTGEALSKNQIQIIRQQFPSSKIYSMYGLTECKRVSCLLPSELDSKWPSVGRPIPGVRVNVIDDFGEAVPIGSKGNLQVLGDNVGLGYLVDKDAKDCTFEKTAEGCSMKTNDIVSLDNEGFLYFHGRSDDIVKIAGKRVSLLEISNALQSHQSVASVKTEQEIDEEGGSKVVARVSLIDGMHATDNELKSHVFLLTGQTHLIPDLVKYEKTINISENLKTI